MATLWSLFVVVVAYLQLARAISSNSGRQIVQDLSAQLSSGSEVILASDASYANNFTQRFSVSRPPSFSVAVKPVSAVDVRQVVQYALRTNVSILATGGGHGYTWSLGRHRGGIDIDLSNFNTIKIDSAANTMTVGGSVRSQDVAAALQAAGKELPVGLCMCVGYTGYTLGGGIGPYSGLYGTAADNLISAEIITGQGELLTVSDKSRSDLFYGLKGAGFNYGIVTSLKFRVHPATNSGQTIVTNMIFPGYLNGTVFELIKSFFGPNQPKELGIALSVGYNEAMGGMVVIIGFVYAGSEKASTELLRPFFDLNPINPQVLDVPTDQVPRVIVYGATLSGCNKNTQFVPYTVNLYKVDVPNLIKVVEYMKSEVEANPELGHVIVTWTQYASAGFKKFADGSAAFPYRDPTVFVQINAYAPSAEMVPVISDYAGRLRERFQRGSGRSRLETYVHFAHGDETHEAMYSTRKLLSLSVLKAVYDPRGLFSWYNPLPALRY
ncbi:6-hydroxy-D-nicotine oxidase [Triangularia verruculosa]|uniref:6-hydroxy-D-nicotine oxidase n=1 Tax=Triangularia verruculosa TaxID=2587418 RepID=A0AAN6XM71_9PEZI|nr:6-hydroxy-D-nicotine oxidase [Triangularia verruculosa]